MSVHISPTNITDFANKPVIFRVIGSGRCIPGFILKDIEQESIIFIVRDELMGWPVEAETGCLRRLRKSPLAEVILPNVSEYCGWYTNISANESNYYSYSEARWKVSGIYVEVLADNEVKEKIVNKKYRWKKRK